MNIAEEIRDFISNKLARGRADIDMNKSLFTEGIIDSFALIELAFFLKENYKVDIDEFCIINNNLESIAKIAQYIEERKK